MSPLQTNQKKIERIAHVGSWHLDFATGISTWSAETCKIYGIDEHDTIHSYEDLEARIHPEDRDKVKNIVADIRQSKSSSGVQHRILLSNGSIREVYSSIECIVDEQGRATGLFGVAQDVTDIVRTKNDLSRSEENMKLIFDLIPLSIYVRRANGDYIFGNHIFLAHYGITAEELKGKNLKDFIKVPEELVELRRQDALVLASEDKLFVTEFHQKNHEGKSTYWRILKIPFIPVGETEMAILGIAEDVTMEKERVNKIVEYSETITERNRQLEQFSFKVSHELRGPLTTIMSVSEVVDKMNLTNEELSLFVEGIRNSVSKMDSVIHELNEIVCAGVVTNYDFITKVNTEPEQ